MKNISNSYIGWSNYSTWRVNQDIFKNWNSKQIDSLTMGDLDNLDEQLKNYVKGLIFEQSSGLAMDYALAFLNDVNWFEIAQHMIEEVEA